MNSVSSSPEKNALGLSYELASIIGIRLQKAREQLSCSKEVIADRVKIRERYIDAIENGEWDVLPPGLNGRGLIRLYARELSISLPEFDEFKKAQTILVDLDSNTEPTQTKNHLKKSRYQPAAEESAEVIRTVPRREYLQSMTTKVQDLYSPSSNAAHKIPSEAPSHFRNGGYGMTQRGVSSSTIVTPKIADIIGIDVQELIRNTTPIFTSTALACDLQLHIPEINPETAPHTTHSIRLVETPPVFENSIDYDQETHQQEKKLSSIKNNNTSNLTTEEPEGFIDTSILSVECATPEPPLLNLKVQNIEKNIEINKNVDKKRTPKISFILLASFLKKTLISFKKKNFLLVLSGFLLVAIGVFVYLISSFFHYNHYSTESISLAPPTKMSLAENIESVTLEPASTEKPILQQATPLPPVVPAAIIRIAKIDILSKVKLQIEVDGAEFYAGIHMPGELEIPFKQKAEILAQDGSKVTLIYGDWEHAKLGTTGRKRKVTLNAADYSEP